MKIFKKEQIYAADKATIQKEEIKSLNLMERAGGYAYDWIHKRLNGQQVPIVIFCGIGNNGGDGLVIARYLIENGYSVHTFIVNYSDKRSDDFLKAYDALKKVTKKWPIVLKEDEDLPTFNGNELIVDAVFGIGLNRPAPEWVQQLFNKINTSRCFILSIDMPSGMYMDKTPTQDEVFIHPTTLLTFQVPKLAFFLPETGKYIRDWDILDIGLDREYLKKEPTQAMLITKELAQQMYKPREKYTHKGTYGHSLIVGGSFGKMGAIQLSCEACLKTGSGLVTAYIPQFAMPILQTGLPEVMVITDKQNGKFLEEITTELDPTVLGIGMGMGTTPTTAKALGNFLKTNKKPLVLDADALNILAEHENYLNLLPKHSILTPHPKELERLIGSWDGDFDKLEKASAFAKKYACVLVIKGSHTITVFEERYYVNTTGNPGMATGGTGDVLTGVITALMAQGYDPLTSATFGVYLHGKSGDIAASKTSYESLTARDVIDTIGGAYKDLFIQPQEQQPS